MEVIWQLKALKDATNAWDYIAKDNPDAASQLYDTINKCTEMLAVFPMLGASGRVENTRELVISGTEYIVVYRINDEIIDILAVQHSAKQYP